MNRILTREAGISLAMIGIFSCSGDGITGANSFNPDDLTADAARIASVAVSFSSNPIAVGDTTRATATLRDYQGLLITRGVTWISSNTAVATVSATGLVTGVAEGTALVTASRAGKSGSGTITVTGGVSGTGVTSVNSVSVTLAASSLNPGQTTQASATTYDAANNVLTGRTISWSSSNTAVATVSASGLVTALAPGTSQITATSETKSGSASVSVTSPQQTTNPGTVTDLNVIAIDSTGVTLSFTQVNDGTGQPAKYDIRYAVSPIAWGSATTATSGTCAAPVAGTAIGSPLVCKVLGLRPSTRYDFQLVAFRGTLNFDAVFGALSIVVSATTTGPAAPPPVPVASVTVSPVTASVQVGGTVQFSAVTRDANNNILTGRSITWSSNNVAVATVSASALGTAVAAGTAQITATSEGKVGSATLTVTSPAPPPPPGSSNEPAGMTTITDRPFNTTNESGWSDWWPSGLITFVSDASAPHSPTGILRATYPTGFAAGSGPGAWDPPLLGNKKTAYIAVWLRHSANWYGQEAGVNKVFYLHASTNDAPVFYFSATGVGTGDLTPQIRLQATVSPPESNLNPNLVPSARMVRGQWNLIEVVAVGNSAGNRDGSIDWYLNGVHIGSYTAIEWQSGGTTWQRLSIAPVWGGIGGTVPATQWLDFDHTYVSVK